jgi:hypothetical protein
MTERVAANRPAGNGRRGTIAGESSSAARREPVRFEADEAPKMTPSVAAVLARIVRSLRDQQKREAA